MNHLDLAIVDAFTCGPFSGNPAAVCLLAGPAEAEWMQAIAAEMNQAETVFVHAEDGRHHLRFFTPRQEVDLCGHATLAAAHRLWEIGAAGDRLAFRCQAGELSAGRDDDRLVLDLPRIDPRPTPFDQALLDILGLVPLAAMQAGDNLLVECHDAATVRGAQVHLGRLAHLPYKGCILTAAGDQGYDVVSRYFGPAVGIAEDQATGSAHCALGPYWAARVDRDELRCYQASRRGGELSVRVGASRVAVAGRTVTAVEGRWVGAPSI